MIRFERVNVSPRRPTLVGAVAVAMALSVTGTGRADLILPTVLADTPVSFLGEVTDTVAGAAVVGGAVLNWTVIVQQAAFVGGAAADDIVVYAQHRVAPHPGEAAPNTIFLGAFANVVPGAGGVRVFRNSVSHFGTATMDYNNMTLTYGPLVAGVASKLTIRIDHADFQGQMDSLPFQPPSVPPTPDTPWMTQAVPEPHPLTLLGAGLALAVLRRALGRPGPLNPAAA